MSEQAQITGGILLLALVTVESGGIYMLALIRGSAPATEFQQKFARAGHAHAGVLLILALVCQAYADTADQSGAFGWLSRSGVAVSAILMPGGFFFSSMGRNRERPNIAIILVYTGGALLAVSLISLGVGLLIA